MVVTIVKSKHAYHNNICGVIYYIMPLVLHHTHTHTFVFVLFICVYVNDKTVLRSYINVICC